MVLAKLHFFAYLNQKIQYPKEDFQGHVHEEIHKEINGIHYITQLGMVDGRGLGNNSFSIVTIDEKQIQIDGYKRASDEDFGL